ncbi:hypothetical protein J6590_087976 [Homalodisca vitripennis]|nr:hypothetical protein J6590_087976 [Homalodisca vitripennis]
MTVCKHCYAVLLFIRNCIRFWFSFQTVRQANCTRQDIERHRLYAGSTGSFADCEEYAHLTSLRHDLTGCGVTGLRSDCDTISQTFLILVWPYSNIELVYTLIESSYGLCGQLQDSLASECLHTR